jgi:hypothetical protein
MDRREEGVKIPRDGLRGRNLQANLREKGQNLIGLWWMGFFGHFEQ